MATAKRKGFFGQAPARPEDELARQRDVEALIAPRRTVVQDLPVDRIRPNPFQARRQFDNLEELAGVIKTQGFTSRLRVRPDPSENGYFQLVYGERRLRAARIAELSEVPCEIAEHTDEELIEIGLAENIQRRDLNPMEEAQAFQTFRDERGYSIRKLAEKIGKDKGYIEDRLAILDAPADVQAMVAQRPDTLRAAREIAKLSTPSERKPLIEGILESKLNVHDIRAIVAEIVNLYLSSQPETKPVEEELERPEQNRNNTPVDVEELAASLPPKKRREPDLQKQIEREGNLLRSVVGRWQLSLEDLNEQQRKNMLFHINQLIPELNNLKKQLKG